MIQSERHYNAIITFSGNRSTARTSICSQHDDLQIVGETSRQESAIEFARTHCPDVIIVEMTLVKDAPQQLFEDLVAGNLQRETKILVLAEKDRLALVKFAAAIEVVNEEQMERC